MSRLMITILILFGLGHSGVGLSQNSNAPAVDRLQFNAVQVTKEQFKPMCDFVSHALAMKQIVSQANLAAFVAANGSIFEIYGPGAPDAAWEHDQAGVVTGFLTSDIRLSSRAVESAGGKLVGDIHVAEHFGIDGGPYAFRLYRAPDGRLYALAQNRNFHK